MHSYAVNKENKHNIWIKLANNVLDKENRVLINKFYIILNYYFFFRVISGKSFKGMKT